MDDDSRLAGPGSTRWGVECARVMSRRARRDPLKCLDGPGGRLRPHSFLLLLPSCAELAVGQSRQRYKAGIFQMTRAIAVA